MKIFKVFVLVTGLAFVSAKISAQENKPTTQQLAQRQTDRIKQNVTGITAAQESQIMTVEQDYTTNMHSAWLSSNGDKSAMKSKMQPIKDTRDAKIKTILTADQYAQYQKMEATHQGGGHRSEN